MRRFEKVSPSLDEEFLCRWGRLFKDRRAQRAPSGFPVNPDGPAPDPALAAEFYRKAIDKCDRAYQIRVGTLPGHNRGNPPVSDPRLSDPLAGRHPAGPTLLESGQLARYAPRRPTPLRTREQDDDEVGSGTRPRPAKPICSGRSRTRRPVSTARHAGARTSGPTPAETMRGRSTTSSSASQPRRPCPAALRPACFILHGSSEPYGGGRKSSGFRWARRCPTASDRRMSLRITCHTFGTVHASVFARHGPPLRSLLDEHAAIPEVRLAAVAITRGPEFFTVFNPKWGAFTLPMTKRRVWTDPEVPAADHEEDPLHAASARRPRRWDGPSPPSSSPGPVELVELQPFQQSDRDGVWKLFRFDVFRMELPGGVTRAGGRSAPSAWLTLDHLRSHQPVSPTAVRIVEAIHASAVLRGER